MCSFYSIFFFIIRFCMPRPHKTNVQFLYIRIVWYNCMYAVCCVYLSFVCLSRFVWAMDMDDDCAVIMFRCMHVCVWAFCCNDRQTVKQARVERHTEAYMQKAHAPIVCVCVLVVRPASTFLCFFFNFYFSCMLLFFRYKFRKHKMNAHRRAGHHLNDKSIV